MTLNSLPAWPALQAHYDAIHDEHLRDWFAPKNDTSPSRAERLTYQGGGIAIDFSKNRITDATLKLLVELAQQAKVAERRDAMFAGEIVNITEHRAVLHTALRSTADNAPFQKEIRAEKAKMAAFADQVRNGQWTGYTGKRIRHVVNIGIGGLRSRAEDGRERAASPRLAGSRHPFRLERRRRGYLQRDAGHRPRGNARDRGVEDVHHARDHDQRALDARLVHQQGLSGKPVAKHFVGVSANPAEVVKFGIAKENVFEMWDWVGGRYSLWSAVGLSIMISVGPKNFEALLEGAHNMDQHFRRGAVRAQPACADGHDRHLVPELLRLAKRPDRPVFAGHALPAFVSPATGDGKQRQVGEARRQVRRLPHRRRDLGRAGQRTANTRSSRCSTRGRPSSPSTSSR